MLICSESAISDISVSPPGAKARNTAAIGSATNPCSAKAIATASVIDTPVDNAASREAGGTGLGLAIVKHIVLRHRGRLTIESVVGEGATFKAILPLLAEAGR